MRTNESRSAALSAGIVEFLLRGIGNDCQPFREQCCQVLESLGDEVIDDLRHTAEYVRLSPNHTRRLAKMIESLSHLLRTNINPIPSVLRAMLAMIAAAHDDEIVLRAVGIVGNILGRRTVVCVVVDELCDHYHDRGYAIRLVNVIAFLSDALAQHHQLYLLQLIEFSSSEVASRCKRLVHWIDDLNLNDASRMNECSDSGCRGLKLLDWLTRAAVVGADTRVTDPEWLWLRDYRYQPLTVNHGPMLAGSR